MSLTAALFLTQKFILITVAIQSLELLALRKAYSPSGVWSWQALQPEFAVFPRVLQKGFGMVFEYRPFTYLLALRLLLTALALVLNHPFIWAALFITSLSISVRWRGAFNGGSDAMTLIVLGGVFLASFNEPRWRDAGLWYIAIQLTLSYLLAGWAKLKNPQWRNGQILGPLFAFSVYEESPPLTRLARSPSLSRLASWGVLLFECLFPLAFLGPRAAAAFTVLAFFFHLFNCYAFGLNRFLAAWMSAYPALLYCSGWS